MRVVILGSGGFIGYNLILYFQNQGNEVTTINKSDFSYPNKLIAAFQVSDVVVNCMGSANVGFSYSNTLNDFESNVVVVGKILEILREHNLKNVKFINLSSAAIYGNPSSLPIDPTHRPLPLSPYGYHKFMAELLLKEYSQCFGLKTLSLRIFSAYGNGQRKLLLWDLHQKIQSTKDEIILFGTGNESRDFIHVDDIAQQILLAINYADFNGEALNVANGTEVKISEIVELYQKYYPTKFVYRFNGEVRLGDPLNWLADISTMKKWGYKQSVMLQKGIDNYLKYLLSE
jgi:UDP-glucose 4-epimerase